ncbi:hypothetical protein BC629DRAFT_1597307 [Irpex lacteus]|nr:hypothetical protein BC629DRAFT_1597307 [Irpex lacteus]
MTPKVNAVSPYHWSPTFTSDYHSTESTHILVQFLPSQLQPWSATKTDERRLTTTYTSPTPVDLVNLTISFRDFDTASAAFYIACQMGDAWVAEREAKFGSTMGFSRETREYFPSYLEVRDVVLPMVWETILHRVEDILDSESCPFGFKTCSATYVALELMDNFRDPIAFLARFIENKEGRGLCIVRHPQVDVKFRDGMTRYNAGNPRPPARKCQKCMRRAKDETDRILEELFVCLPRMLRGNERAFMKFHDSIFR